MKNNISSMAALNEEVKRLKVLEKEQEQGIKEKMQAIAEAYQPANLLKRTLSGAFSGSEAGKKIYPLLINAGVDILLNQLIKRSGGGLVRTAGFSLLKGVVSNLTSSGSGALLDKLKGLLRNKSNDASAAGMAGE